MRIEGESLAIYATSDNIYYVSNPGARRLNRSRLTRCFEWPSRDRFVIYRPNTIIQQRRLWGSRAGTYQTHTPNYCDPIWKIFSGFGLGACRRFERR